MIRTFPEGVREDLGAELRRLQEGMLPLHSRPMTSIGRGVFELREQDEQGWYRVIYLSKIGSAIHVLHCFRKQSKKTSKNDLEVAKGRLMAVRARLRQGEKL